ncbi:MAG: ABC transporter permease [Acidimicrobiia bacterium]
MNALARAELLKLRSTRILGWLLAATLTMVLVTIIASVPTTGPPHDVMSLDDPALLARIVGVSFLWPQLTVALLGVLIYTQEERYGTITSTFLVEPQRRRVLAAKGLALALASAVLAVAILAASLIASAALIRARHGNATLGVVFWQVVAAAFLVMALSGLIGLAVGALLRNQIVAVTLTLIWLTVGEHLLIEALPQVARWTPGGATDALLQLGADATTTGTLLKAPFGGLLLVGYTAAAVGLAIVIAPRRDVL